MTLFFHPVQNLRCIRDRPRWLLIFLALVSINILIELFKQPYLVQSLLHHLPRSVTEQDKLMVVQSLEQELFARMAFLPIRLLIGWGSFALLLHFISTSLLSQQPIRYVHVFSLEVRAESMLILAKGAALFRLMIDSSSLSARSIIPFSCAEIFPVSDYSFFMFLNSLNLFTFAYLAILIAGISVLYAVSKVKALFFVILACGISLLFNISIVTVLRDQLHLLVN